MWPDRRFRDRLHHVLRSPVMFLEVLKPIKNANQASPVEAMKARLDTKSPSR